MGKELGFGVGVQQISANTWLALGWRHALFVLWATSATDPAVPCFAQHAQVMSQLKYDKNEELSYEQISEGLQYLGGCGWGLNADSSCFRLQRIPGPWARHIPHIKKLSAHTKSRMQLTMLCLHASVVCPAGYRLEPSEVAVLMREVALGSDHSVPQSAFLASQVDWWVGVGQARAWMDAAFQAAGVEVRALPQHFVHSHEFQPLPHHSMSMWLLHTVCEVCSLTHTHRHAATPQARVPGQPPRRVAGVPAQGV